MAADAMTAPTDQEVKAVVAALCLTHFTTTDEDRAKRAIAALDAVRAQQVSPSDREDGYRRGQEHMQIRCAGEISRWGAGALLELPLSREDGKTFSSAPSPAAIPSTALETAREIAFNFSLTYAGHRAKLEGMIASALTAADAAAYERGAREMREACLRVAYGEHPMANIRALPIPSGTPSTPSTKAQDAQDSGSPWQPIETAPLNERVLVWAPEHDFDDGLPDLYVVCIYDFLHGFVIDELRAPTHWMPLPAPPLPHPPGEEES